MTDISSQIRIFVSYSHKRPEYFHAFMEDFETQMKLLEGTHVWKIDIYTDEQIPLGANWHETLQKKILACDVALLLISDAYFTSEYIKRHELDQFIEPQVQKNRESFARWIVEKGSNHEKWRDFYKRLGFKEQE